jgi:hypothetical protein
MNLCESLMKLSIGNFFKEKTKQKTILNVSKRLQSKSKGKLIEE